MCLRSWLRAGIKLMDGQDANVTSSQEPLRGSKSTTEADSIPVLSEGADNTGEYEVVYVTEEEEWSESDVYSTEDNDFALEYFQKK